MREIAEATLHVYPISTHQVLPQTQLLAFSPLVPLTNHGSIEVTIQVAVRTKVQIKVQNRVEIKVQIRVQVTVWIRAEITAQISVRIRVWNKSWYRSIAQVTSQNSATFSYRSS